jgi:hypothetical protein
MSKLCLYKETILKEQGIKRMGTQFAEGDTHGKFVVEEELEVGL